MVEKIDALVDRQLVTATRLPEELYHQKFKALSAEQERPKAILDDFDASVTQQTQDTINELNFTLHLRQRFAEGERDKKLEILRRLGQTIQLKDGELIFRFKPMFHELAEGKLRMKRALGPIQPISDLENRSLR